MTGKQSEVTRRRFLTNVTSTLFASTALPGLGTAMTTSPGRPALRSINVMNFIRAEEPREPMDLMLPVREQMRVIKAHALPATWLLQYDAMVQGPYTAFLKQEMPRSHETGLWFEMNRRLCDDAGIPWRGKPEWEWDYHVPVAYSIGYPPDHRRRLADAAVASYRRIFGQELRSVASWNLDAVTVQHFAEHHGVQAFGNCRDQLATDGFTIWGGALAGYYPSRRNVWSPATSAQNQINAPIFRLLGQDPVYYYDNSLPYPDTMEPVWSSGRSQAFIGHFLDMIAKAPTEAFAYAQLGQENSFGWPEMQDAYPRQMQALAKLRSAGAVQVETMAETGRRFMAAFTTTPTQAQIMLEDPFGRTDPGERTLWYQNRFYRANLHMRGDEFYLRDLHVYDDRFEQPYLEDIVTQHGIEQRLLATLDGYHWSEHSAKGEGVNGRAMGRFSVLDPDGREEPLRLRGVPTVFEKGTTLVAELVLQGGGTLRALFTEQGLTIRLIGVMATKPLRLCFEWDPAKTAFVSLQKNKMMYRFRGFIYEMQVVGGTLEQVARGVRCTLKPHEALLLGLRQPAR